MALSITTSVLPSGYTISSTPQFSQTISRSSSSTTRYPKAINPDGRHIVCNFLRFAREKKEKT